MSAVGTNGLGNKGPLETAVLYKLQIVASSFIEFSIWNVLWKVISRWMELRNIWWHLFKLLGKATSLLCIIFEAHIRVKSQFQFEELDEMNFLILQPVSYQWNWCNGNEEWICMGFKVEREQIWELHFNNGNLISESKIPPSVWNLYLQNFFVYRNLKASHKNSDELEGVNGWLPHLQYLNCSFESCLP